MYLLQRYRTHIFCLSRRYDIIVYYRLTSPMLLIVIGICGGAVYYVGVKSQSQQKIKVMGMLLLQSLQKVVRPASLVKKVKRTY